MTSRPLGAVALALVLLAVPACGDDDGPAPTTAPPPSTTAPSTSTTPESRDEATLRHLATEWFEVRRDIYNDGADVGRAEDFVTGEYLADFRQRVSDLAESGNQVRDDPSGRTSHTTESVTVDGDNAELIECLVDGDLLLAPDGSVLNDEVNAYLARTTAVRGPQGWRFTSQTEITTAEGSEQCIES